MEKDTLTGTVLEETQSLCPVCLQTIPAHYLRENDEVFLAKSCPEHGSWKTLVWEAGPDFSTWDSGVIYSRPANTTQAPERGCPYDCGLCSAHAQAACCVLIEITQRCNQACPYCFASSQRGEGAPADYSLSDMERIFNHLRQQSPENLFNIQLSGGEPTLHPELPQIISLAKSMGFPYVQVNTNGRRFAEEPGYARELFNAGLDSVFLQFDGTSDDIYNTLRGEPLFALKKRAIDNCAAAQLGVVLVVTAVRDVNGGDIGNILRFATDRLPAVRGVHFQPVSYFGRFPQEPANHQRLTIPGLFRLITEQTGGLMTTEDFVPLASGHGRCSFHGNFLVLPNGGIQGLSGRSDDHLAHNIEKARAYLAKKWSPPKGSCCGGKTESPPAALSDSDAFDREEWETFVDTLQDGTLSLTAMAFQDVWTADLKRLNRCRLHVATRDLKLVPFCSFNLTNCEGERLHPQTGRN